MLAVGGSPGVQTDMLNETGAGTHAFSKEEVRDFLVNAYHEFKTQGFVSYRGEPTSIAKYTHWQMARRIAEVLDLVSGKSQPASDTAVAPSASWNGAPQFQPERASYPRPEQISLWTSHRRLASIL